MSVVTRVRTLDPLTLGPALWLDDTGSDASVWTDKSGNGRDATQVTVGAQPQIVPNVLNGKQVRRFDGGDWLTAGTTSTWKFLHDGTANEVFVVVKAGISSNPNAVYAITSTGGEASAAIGYYVGYDDRLEFSRNNMVINFVAKGTPGDFTVSNLCDNVMLPNTFSILRASSKANASPASERSKISVNGKPEQALNINTGTPSTSNSTSALIVGAYLNGTAAQLVGDIAEIIIYHYALTSYERQLVEGYLSYKYALPVA